MMLERGMPVNTSIHPAYCDFLHAGKYFNPPSLLRFFLRYLNTSIHAARMGCDKNGILNCPWRIISIHAARMGCDHERHFRADRRYRHFNPRSPNGLRQPPMGRLERGADFNPRSPNGLRQSMPLLTSAYSPISIHAARMGCDHTSPVSVFKFIYFNPRSPNGLRHADRLAIYRKMLISIHAARMGCDECSNKR